MKNEGEFHLQLYATSPAPKRDYHGLTITSTHIILNSWDISRGRHIYPRRRKLSLDNFHLDKGFCCEIQHLFGNHVLEYINRLVNGDKNLYSLPEKVFRKIIRYLAVSDIIKLRQTSKIFFEMCNTNDIWKIVFQKKLKRLPTKTELNISEVMSWNYMLKRKVLEKTENKKIYETFKHGVEKLRKDTKKEADKIRKNSLSSKSEMLDRKPPDDLFKNQKLQVRTYKGTERPKTAVNTTPENKIQQRTKPNNEKVENTSLNKNVQKIQSKSSIQKPVKEKESASRHTNKVGNNQNIVKTKTENKVEIDLRTKSSCQLHKNDKTQEKNVNLNKNAKDIRNLKSKSVFL